MDVLFLSLLLLGFCLGHCTVCKGGCVRVTSQSGTFLGVTLESRRGRVINAFRGIRYAEPPVGELRFKPPQLIRRYTGQVNATADGPACPQPGTWLGLPDEDCLRINVYTHAGTGNVRKPVLVYMHPGGFYSVSGQGMLNGPQYLMDHDIVLVTINYRLGSLGFISTGDRLAPGNNGFKDQVAALRWIQRNIASFGGDPRQVTISGYSAGSLSVTLHMLSPMSAGLFHRAISMSATTTAQWKIGNHQFDLAQKQASLVGCPNDTSRVIMDCLKKANAIEIGNSLSGFYEFSGIDPVLIWNPVVEPDFGQERFLTDQPVKLIQEGKFHDVPLIIGQSELEFAGQALKLLLNSTSSKQMEDNWYQVAPISFQYEKNTPVSHEASTKLREFYLGNRSLKYSNDTAFALGRLYGDGIISFGVHRFAHLMAKRLESPVYYYKFNFTGNESHVYYPGTTTPIGAVHHDDLIYLFQSSISFTPITLQSPYSFMVDKMTTMWTNFAIHGNPKGRLDQPILKNLTWPEFNLKDRKYLQINAEFEVLSNMYEDRFNLWDSLFPIQY